MDEPTASLSRHEVEPLFAVIDRLRAAGVGGVVHQPPPRRGVQRRRRCHGDARRRRGCAGGGERVHAPSPSWQAMFGRSGRHHSAYRRLASSASRRACASRCRRCRPPASTTSTFTVAAGEIVAVTGGIGAGVSELAHGARRWHRSRTAARSPSPIGGTPRTSSRGRRQALSLGVAFLPADRKRQGLLLDKSVADNIVLGQQATGRHRSCSPRRRFVPAAVALAPRANVKTANDRRRRSARCRAATSRR